MWREMTLVQLWRETYFGELRPQPFLRDRREIHYLCDVLCDEFESVQGDYVQTMELALLYEEKKSLVLGRKLKALGVKACLNS